MVVYIPNANVLAIELLCRELADGPATPARAAVTALLAEIERQKQGAPFRLWQREQGSQP